MAITNKLRARLELLGGKEVERDFENIGLAAKKGFGTIEREAKEATRDVKELERELAKLEAESKAIRASIKVKKGQSPTSEQQEALAVARKLDQQAETMRMRIRTMQDSLKLGGGNALRAFSNAADKDFFKVADGATAIDDAVTNIRKNGGLGGLISDDQLNKLSAISTALRNEGSRYGEMLQHRVSRADATDAEKAQKKLENQQADEERFRKRQEAVAKAKARERAKDEERDANRQRTRDEKNAEYLSKLDERLAQQRIQNDNHVQRVREANYRRDAAVRQRDLERRQAQSRLEIARQVSRDQIEARRRRQASAGDWIPGAIADRDALLARQARLEELRNTTGIRSVLKSLSETKLGSNISSKISALSPTAIRQWINDAEGLGKVGAGFKGTGKLIVGVAGDIARGLHGSAGDIGKFVKALEGLSTAVGSAALRTGIAGLLGALAGGLAALGGGAVLAGIAAIAGIAGWDATKIANAAKTVGTSLKSFSALRYGAQISGVNFDDFVGGVGSLRGKMLDIASGKKDAQNASGLFAKYGINIRTPDGKDLRDTLDVLKDIAKVYASFDNQTLKNAFLDAIGGDSMRNLIPVLENGPKGIEKFTKEAERLGVVLDDKLVKDMEVLNAEVFKFLNVWRGIAYSIGREVLPVLKPVMDQINDFLIGHRDDISRGVIATWNYLIQVIKDFWALWKSGGETDTVIAWTKTLYNGVQTVGNIFGWMWSQIKTGYGYAEPYLQKISDYFGLNGPLEVALILAGGWALGFFEIFTNGGKVAVAGITLIANALNGLLIAPLLRIMGVALAIVGWPALLAGGLVLVYSYWDDIVGIFQAAWSKFKETFPQTATVLEKAFGPALETIRKFWNDFASEFAANFPNLKGTMDGISAAIHKIIDALAGLNWSNLVNGLSAGIITTLQGLMKILDIMANSVGQIGSFMGLWDQPGTGTRNAELQMLQSDPSKWNAYSSMLGGNTDLTKFAASLGTTPQALASGFSGVPASPASAASGASAGAQVGTAQPLYLQINEGDAIYAVSTDPNASSKLTSAMSSQARARIVR